MVDPAREQITEWLTGSATTYLLGAGCSHCAGKPLMETLTNRIVGEIDADIHAEFTKLRGIPGRGPTVEDLLNYFVKYADVVRRLKEPSNSNWLTSEWIENALAVIKKAIVEQIADNWIPSDHHKRFLERVKNVGRTKKARDVFTLNYDTVIEASLDSLLIPYIDGFRGSQNAWFDDSVYDEPQSTGPYFRLFKLHGSVNWTRETDGRVRRKVVTSSKDATDAVVVYPTEQKYLVTQYGVYEMCMKRFRDCLRQYDSNACLVVLGYSFNDEHINEAIIDSITTSRNNLTVLAFIGPEQDFSAQCKRIYDIQNRCDHRFNAWIGNSIFIGSAMTKDEAKIVLDKELWKFENIANYIAGQ